MATAGRIDIFINASTKKFEDGIARAQKGIRSFTKGFADINGFVSVVQKAFSLASDAAAAFSEEIDKLDNLVDTAQRLDIAVDSLQKFQRAAEIAGGDIESLNKAFVIFQKTLGKAAFGDKSANRALERLNIEVDEITKMGLSDAFGLALTRLGELPNAEERAAIGADLFGRAASNLTGLMADGSSAIKQATDDLNKYGVSLNGRTEDIDRAKRAMEQFNMATAGLKTEATLAFAPTGADISTGAATSIALLRNMNKTQAFIDLLLSPIQTTKPFNEQMRQAVLKTFSPGPFSSPSAPSSQLSAPSGQFPLDAFQSSFLDYRRITRARSFGAAPDMDVQNFSRFMRLASLPEFEKRLSQGAPGGAAALEFGSAAAFSAIQQSRREDEMYRLQKQEVDESKRQTQILEDIHRDGLNVFTLGLQG